MITQKHGIWWLVQVTLMVLAGGAYAQEHYLLSPTGHQDVIVVEHHNRLWQCGAQGPVASALTGPDVTASSPALSPDGKLVAYVGLAGGGAEVFVVPAAGGASRRLTYDGGGSVRVQGWLSNEEVLFSTSIKSKKRGSLLYVVDVVKGLARPLPLMEASEGCVVGGDFVFTKHEKLEDSNKGYSGGYAQKIYKISLSLLVGGNLSAVKKRAVLLSRGYDGASRSPIEVAGRVCFLSDRSGRQNVWSMTCDGYELTQHTFESEFDIESISKVSDTQVLFQRMGGIYRLSMLDGAITRVDIRIPDGEVLQHEDLTFALGDATDFDVSDNCESVVAIIRGKLWAVDAASGNARMISGAAGVRIKSLAMSPDGGAVIAMSDSSGEYDFYRYGLRGVKSVTRIVHGVSEPLVDFYLSPTGDRLLVRSVSGALHDVHVEDGVTRRVVVDTRTRPEDVAWSADGRYAAFVTYTSADIGRVTVYDSRFAVVRYVSSGRYDVSSPVFGPDGSELFYAVHNNLRSSSVDTWAPLSYGPSYNNRSTIQAVRVAGLASRGPVMARALPVVAGNYDGLFVAGSHLYSQAKVGVRDQGGVLVRIPVEVSGSRKAPEVVHRGPVAAYRVSRGGKAIIGEGPAGVFLIQADSGGRFGQPVQLGPISGLGCRVDLAGERRQMFGETWRLYRDYFWDPGMRGVDWVALRAKYEPYLPAVSTRRELNELVSHMVAELGAGHTNVGSPVARSSDDRAVGRLGCEYEDNDGLVVSRVYDGDVELVEERSPLTVATPAIQVGDRIERVNGFPVRGEAFLGRLMIGQVGRAVLLSVRRSDGRLHDIRVAPISAQHEARLRARNWAVQNEQYVEQRSGARVGYIRLDASYEADFSRLMREYPQHHRKQGLILDLRGNNGGNMDPWILHFLQRRTWLYVKDRYDAMYLKHPRESLSGNLIVLIDGDTYSDGELIAEGVRRLGLGVLVGARTSGAGKWVNDDNSLVDGARVRIPVSSSYVLEGGELRGVVEGGGVTPDLLVENDPYDFYRGHDAQLEAAIDYALRSSAKRSGPDKVVTVARGDKGVGAASTSANPLMKQGPASIADDDLRRLVLKTDLLERWQKLLGGVQGNVAREKLQQHIDQLMNVLGDELEGVNRPESRVIRRRSR